MRKYKAVIFAAAMSTAILAMQETALASEVSGVIVSLKGLDTSLTSGGPGVKTDPLGMEEPSADPVDAAEVQTNTYSPEDLEVLAHAICGEAQSCPDEEQLYVGSVILNRKNHSAYPNTIKGVVFQKGQYACTWDGNYYRQPTKANYRNAKWLLENGSVLPGNVVYQSGHRQGKGVYLQTRFHKYCIR